MFSIFLIYTYELFLQSSSSSPIFPSGWGVLGWVIAAAVAVFYFFAGYSDKISGGRKELLEISDKKYSVLQKEKEELEFRLKEEEKRNDILEKEKSVVEKDKLLLMREHHQLLEISVADLKTITSNARLITDLENEVNRYREEKGLQPKPKNVNPSRTE